MQRSNKFASTCATCGRPVAPGDGVVLDVSGARRVVHAECPPPVGAVPPGPTFTVRSADGAPGETLPVAAAAPTHQPMRRRAVLGAAALLTAGALALGGVLLPLGSGTTAADGPLGLLTTDTPMTAPGVTEAPDPTVPPVSAAPVAPAPTATDPPPTTARLVSPAAAKVSRAPSTQPPSTQSPSTQPPAPPPTAPPTAPPTTAAPTTVPTTTSRRSATTTTQRASTPTTTKKPRKGDNKGTICLPVLDNCSGG